MYVSVHYIPIKPGGQGCVATTPPSTDTHGMPHSGSVWLGQLTPDDREILCIIILALCEMLHIMCMSHVFYWIKHTYMLSGAYYTWATDTCYMHLPCRQLSCYCVTVSSTRLKQY